MQPSNWVCCAYLRKSREDDSRASSGIPKEEITKETLARHRRIINGLADENQHKISQWYTEVKSGETSEGRDAIKLLLSDLASGKWDAVYVVEASRLGRGGGADQEKIVNAFRYTGTWLITEDKRYDPESKSDMKQLKNELRSSEDELDSITARLIRGKVRSAKEGRWQSTGRTPYGWTAVRIRGIWQLRPDENHPHMLRIYDLLEAGYGFSAIADTYNREHVPTARGGYHWTAAAMRAIALNPANCGYVRYAQRHVQRVFDPETFEVHKVRVLNEDPIIVKGLHYGTGGIPKERFDRITRRLTESARVHAGRELLNPLAGILRCGKCGYSMNYHQMSSGKSKAYFYQHKRPKAMTRECDGCRGARATLVMEVLIETLKRTIDDIEMRIGSDDGTSEYESRLSSLRTALEKEEAARSRAMEAFEAGIYSIDELKDRKDKADRNIRSIEREMSELKPPQYTPGMIVSLHECIDLLTDDSIAAQSKNDLLKSLIARIDYYNDTEPYVLPNKIHLDIFLR